jgi:DNA-binding MarR family transcriptional regulator
VSEAAAEARLELGRFLPYRLSVTAECTGRLFAESYERGLGLSIPEWRVMAVLGEGAPCPTQAVIETTEMDRVKVSRAVTRLVDKGLVTRRTHPEDQRSQILSLSRKGMGLYRQIVPLAHALQARPTEGLNQAELAVLDRVLERLHTRARSLARAE